MQLNDKKITIVALHLGTGGVEKYISSLCKMLENDYQIDIISSYKIGNKPGYYFSDKINIKYLIDDRPYKNEFIKAIKNFNIIDIIKYGFKNFKVVILKPINEYKAIKKIDSKYVITTLFHNKLVGKLLNDDYIKIATEHNYHNNDDGYIKKVISSCKNSNYLICISKELKNFYSDKFINSKTKVLYIPNVLDEMPIITEVKEKNTLISVGRLVNEKGFSDLLDVVAIIKTSITDIKLNIIGDGYEKDYLNNKIKDLNLENNVFLLGTKSHDEVNKFMQQSMLYVMTSYTESFGLVLVEAMSNKIPCIAFDSASGAKDLLGNNIGILIKSRNKEDMAKEIIRLLSDGKILDNYSKEGYKYCQKYLLNNIKIQWLNFLKEI